MTSEDSRSAALEAIGKAQGLAQVLELANKALAERQSWGDDFTGSCAAAKKWAGFFFPIDAPESGAEIRGEIFDRNDFLAVGVSAAKAVAKALLAPLPPADDEKNRQANWDRVSRAVEQSATSTLAFSALAGQAYAHDLFGFESLFSSSAKEWEAAAHIKTWEPMEALLLRPHESQLETSCGASGASAFRAQWDACSSDFSSVGALMRETDVGFMLSGPAGGVGVIAKGAELLRQSYRQLGELTELPKEALSMGLRGMALNLRSDSSLAYHNPAVNLMAFGSAPSHLGHEWTHLMDHRVQKHGTAAQKKALAELNAAPFKLAPDPALVSSRREEMIKGCRDMLGHFLHAKGKDDLVQRHAIAPKEEGGEWSCDDAFFNEIAKAAGEGLEPYTRAIVAARDPSKPEINADALEWWWGEIKEAAGLNPQANAVCDFVREAQIQDGLGYAKKGYFTSEKEMIARIAEAHFYARGSSPAVAWERVGGARIEPRGQEAIELSGKYQNLIDALRADPEPLMSDAARARLMEKEGQASVAKQEPSVAEPSMAFNVSAWRQRRSQSDEAQSAVESRPQRPGL